MNGGFHRRFAAFQSQVQFEVKQIDMLIGNLEFCDIHMKHVLPCKSKSLLYERFCTSTRFETEAQDNSEMAASRRWGALQKRREKNAPRYFPYLSLAVYAAPKTLNASKVLSLD